jgi:hypothetical protein
MRRRLSLWHAKSATISSQPPRIGSSYSGTAAPFFIEAVTDWTGGRRIPFLLWNF